MAYQPLAVGRNTEEARHRGRHRSLALTVVCAHSVDEGQRALDDPTIDRTIVSRVETGAVCFNRRELLWRSPMVKPGQMNVRLSRAVERGEDHLLAVGRNVVVDRGESWQKGLVM